MTVLISIHGEYTVLPIRLPPSTSSSNTILSSAATHYIYFRPHEPKIPTLTSERSLFLVNLPIDATSVHIRALFSTVSGGVSRIEDVQFGFHKQTSEINGDSSTTTETPENRKKSKKRKHGDEPEKIMTDLERFPSTWDRALHRSGATAVVVFVDKSSMETAVKGISKLWREKEKELTKRKKKRNKSEKDKDDDAEETEVQFVTWGEGISEEKEKEVPSLGLQRYLNHHKLTFPPRSTLQTSVDSYMTAFTEQETRELRTLSRKHGVPDEEGFVTVYRGGRSGGVKMEVVEELLARKKVEEEKAQRENAGFYRFQVRERRKEAAKRLLEKFEQDKKRVAERKSMRKFKPL